MKSIFFVDPHHTVNKNRPHGRNANPKKRRDFIKWKSRASSPFLGNRLCDLLLFVAWRQWTVFRTFFFFRCRSLKRAPWKRKSGTKTTSWKKCLHFSWTCKHRCYTHMHHLMRRQISPEMAEINVNKHEVVMVFSEKPTGLWVTINSDTSFYELLLMNCSGHFARAFYDHCRETRWGRRHLSHREYSRKKPKNRNSSSALIWWSHLWDHGKYFFIPCD